LTTMAQVDAWLTEETASAMRLQMPLAIDELELVARGKRTDPL